jgi:hypothetical protein
MSAFTNYLETQLANYHKGTDLPTAPTPYLRLYDGDPGEDAGSATEVTTDIRAAGGVAVTFAAPAGDAIFNSAIIDFGNADAGATLAGFAVADAATAGNPLVYGATTSKTVNTGDPVSVAINDLAIGISGTCTTALINIILNWIGGSAAPAAPTLYVLLWDGDPLTTGTDVTATIRAAGGLPVTFGTATNGSFSNSAAVDFGNADGAADITHFSINTAADGSGTTWHTNTVASSKNVNAGDPVNFPTGAIQVTIN